MLLKPIKDVDAWISTTFEGKDEITQFIRLRGSGCAHVKDLEKNGFQVRGWVREEEGFLELFKPCKQDITPPLITSRIGVLCILHDNRNFYVVKEKFGPPQFKFVSGSVNSGETPHAAASREVSEELGIEVSKEKCTLHAVHLDFQAKKGVDDYCFVFLIVIEPAERIVIDKKEIVEFLKIPMGNFESFASQITTYTASIIRRVLFEKPLPVPLLRGGKQIHVVY